MFLSAKSPRKSKLSSKIAQLSEENKKLKQEIEKQRQEEQKKEIDENGFKELCDRFLTPSLSSFVKLQLSHMNRDIRGHRYTNEFKKFAMSLYFLGPKCYRQLQKTFSLPSPRVLQRFVEKVVFHPGINKQLFEFLRAKVEKMTPTDRYCVLCMDEMSIKCNLYYDIGTDTIVGFEDNGHQKTTVPANMATVIMARGIKNNWKQPLAYTFSQSGCSSHQLKEMLDAVVGELTEVGLHVVALISDMGSNFVQLANMLDVTADNPEIELGNQKLVYYFDPPHLLKAVRNNILDNHLIWDDKKTSWDHIATFYNNDKQLNNRLAPKLTKSHIDPTKFERMRVKYATQVLSATVAAGMETYVSLGYQLDETARGTVEVISRFDKLFDIVNSSKVFTSKPFNKAFKGQEEYLAFLDDTRNFLAQVKIVSKENRTKTSYVKCINGWQVTISALLHLWDFLKNEGFTFLLTRRLNQDSLENFFGSIRQQSGNAVNPTPIQFSRAFKKLFLMSFFHSNGMNCAEDFEKLLLDLTSFAEIQPIAPAVTEELKKAFVVENCDYHSKSLPEQNAFKYVAGYLIEKCLQIHSCNTCIEFSKINSELDDSSLFLHFKAYNMQDFPFGSLKSPHELFYKHIFLLESTFFSNIENFLNNPRVGNRMYELLKTVEEFKHPCENFPGDYLLKLFVRLRIYYILKFNNREFKHSSGRNRKLSILMNM